MKLCQLLHPWASVDCAARTGARTLRIKVRLRLQRTDVSNNRLLS